MKIKLLILFFSTCFSCVFVCAEDAVHDSDIKSFVKNADLCQHFSGEIDNSTQSKAQLISRINKANKYCNRAKKQRAILIVKYRGNKEVENIIYEYEILSPD